MIIRIGLVCLFAVNLGAVETSAQDQTASQERGSILDPAAALERQRKFYERLLTEAAIRERTLRADALDAQQRAATADGRVAGLESRITELTQQSERLAAAVTVAQAEVARVHRIALGWQTIADQYAADLVRVHGCITATVARLVDGTAAPAP